MIANMTGTMDDYLVAKMISQYDWDYGWLFGYLNDSQFDWHYGWLFGYVKW